MTGSFWLGMGSLMGFLSVAFGAFGAHALAARLDGRAGEIYRLAAQYQMYHALALVALGLWCFQRPELAHHTWTQTAGWGFLLGSLVFAGSLYALALTNIKILGAITPIGGVGFLIGWASLAMLALRR